MKERTIDILLRDVIGDDGLKDESEETKFCLALIMFLYQKKHLTYNEGKITDDVNNWLAQLDLQPLSVEAGLLRLRDLGILDASNDFRMPMKELDNITLIMFAMVLNGKLEVSMKNGEYAFKQTDEGREEVERIIATPEGKAFFNQLDKELGDGKHQI